jgi:hypothetical protein
MKFYAARRKTLHVFDSSGESLSFSLGDLAAEDSSPEDRLIRDPLFREVASIAVRPDAFAGFDLRASFFPVAVPRPANLRRV